MEKLCSLFSASLEYQSTLSVRLLSLTVQITAAILRGIHGI